MYNFFKKFLFHKFLSIHIKFIYVYKLSKKNTFQSVWIKFQPISWVPLPKYVTVAVFERSVNGDATHFLLSERIATPNNGFKWENVAAGDYLIFVYVNRFDCQLNCGAESSAAFDDPTCKICPHTVLNFTVLENKFSVSYQRSYALMGFLKAVVIAVFGEFLMVA